MQGIVHIKSLVVEVEVVIIFSVEIYPPLPKPAKYRDAGMELPSPKDWGICIPVREAVISVLGTTTNFSAVVVVIVVFEGLFVTVIVLFDVLNSIGTFILPEDGVESCFGEARDLIDAKSNEYQWDEYQGRDPDY